MNRILIPNSRSKQKCNPITTEQLTETATGETCLAYATTFTGMSGTPYHPLLACALFIVPGVPIINFVDDMIDNYIQVGIVRAVNTVLMVCAMAFGIVIVMRLLAEWKICALPLQF